MTPTPLNGVWSPAHPTPHNPHKRRHIFSTLRSQSTPSRKNSPPQKFIAQKISPERPSKTVKYDLSLTTTAPTSK